MRAQAMQPHRNGTNFHAAHASSAPRKPKRALRATMTGSHLQSVTTPELQMSSVDLEARASISALLRGWRRF